MKRLSFLGGLISAALLAATVHASDSTRETILTGGQAAVITGDAVQIIPISQAPAQLQAALSDDRMGR